MAGVAGVVRGQEWADLDHRAWTSGGPHSSPVGAGTAALTVTNNLVVNGDAESGSYATDYATAVAPTGWTISSNFDAIAYSIGGTNDLNSADSIAVGGGNAYFAGGPNTNFSSAEQFIDLSAYAAQIDTGGVSITISGDFGGFLDQDDNISLASNFEDAARHGILVGPSLGGFRAAARSDETKLIHDTATVTLPVGTRVIELHIDATRLSAGTFNDGYADNISVTLQGNNLSGGLVLVAASHNYVHDDVGSAAGVKFAGTGNTAATFTATQIEPLNQIVGDDFHNTLKVKVGAAHEFLAGGLAFVNWQEGVDKVIVTGSAKGDLIDGTSVNDTISGGNGNDLIMGLRGADALTGGAGKDHFVYGDPYFESNAGAYDTITSFDCSQDRFEMHTSLPTAVDAAIVGGKLANLDFAGDLANLVKASKLHAGHAVLVEPSAGAHAGETFLVVDCNGVAGFQAGADMVLRLDAPLNLGAFDIHDFIVA
jgi:Ca2+-binding RTX toxin-like protein